jgi:ectoine hydroxylase-related dioxygenase (phytanoyl-CoA dioxygenase family)
MSVLSSHAVLLPDATPQDLSPGAIAFYREHGFVRVRGIISEAEADEFREVALDISGRDKRPVGNIFDQHVNVWTEYEAIRPLTLHSTIAQVAQALVGSPLRLWHDHILIKQPHNNAATEFHQDQPYWPHAEGPDPISCWVALCDVPVERGCMTFLPGSHRRTDLAAQNLGDAGSLFSLAPDLQWSERVTVPLRKGDCTFHHGRCAHMATPNFTDDPRVAHVIIYMNADTRYERRPHIVTDPLNLEAGQIIEGELFPRVDDFAS